MGRNENARTESWFERVSGWMTNIILIAIVGELVNEYAGIFAASINDVLWIVAAYRWGYGSKRVRQWQLGERNRSLQARARVLAYIPLAIVLIGAQRIIEGAPRLDAPRWMALAVSGPVLVRGGVMFAAFLMGMRASMHEFEARDFARDLLYGPARWLIPAILGSMAVDIAPVEDMLAMLAVVVFSCVMIAWQREPMFLTRRGIMTWESTRPLIMKF
jgi:hypothetical protein